MNNKQLRERFINWREANYNPPFVKLAKEIGIGYSDFCAWYKDKFEYGDRNLGKIKKFLDEKESK